MLQSHLHQYHLILQLLIVTSRVILATILPSINNLNILRLLHHQLTKINQIQQANHPYILICPQVWHQLPMQSKQVRNNLKLKSSKLNNKYNITKCITTIIIYPQAIHCNRKTKYLNRKHIKILIPIQNYCPSQQLILAIVSSTTFHLLISTKK